MTRTWMLALPAAIALVLAACGGDDDKTDDATPNGEASPTTQLSESGQPRADAGIPAPTKVADDGIALSVVFGDQAYSPTVAEFRELPKVEITAAGTKQSGVTITALADKVGASSAGTVTIDGLRTDLKRGALTRYRLADIGSNTIVTLDDEGHVNLYSSTIAAAEWLRVLNGISFTQ
jgi:hypothetical protein